MNLGSLTTIGFIRPKNLIHFVFDNSIHETTGGQPTHTSKIHIEKLARSANYFTFKTGSKKRLGEILEKIKSMPSPIMILVKIKQNNYVSKRVSLPPSKIRDRFMNSLS